MAILNFSHPLMDSVLSVETGADMIRWSYGTNTQTYPTYGGEVVQILSVYIDNLSIEGTLRSYQDAENIYRWFIQYIETATQGSNPDHPAYSEEPVVMFYPERGWRVMIQPMNVPGFTLSNETIAPRWQIEAAVYEADPQMSALTLQAAVKGLTDLSADIGFEETNPFSDPKAHDKKKKDQAIDNLAQALDPIAAAFLGEFQKLAGGDASDLIGETKLSGPAPDIFSSDDSKTRLATGKAL